MSAKQNEIYRCNLCGLVIEVVRSGGCPPACCGESMQLMRENDTDGAAEKHVPVVEAKGSDILVRVGEVDHPMEPDHYIEWIEVINGSYINRYHLKPGDAPRASFYGPMRPDLVVREYCNKHGLWVNKKK